MLQQNGSRQSKKIMYLHLLPNFFKTTTIHYYTMLNSLLMYTGYGQK